MHSGRYRVVFCNFEYLRPIGSLEKVAGIYNRILTYMGDTLGHTEICNILVNLQAASFYILTEILQIT